jgi:prepilin-type N-terminal cleavage/methylation domain-containing protein
MSSACTRTKGGFSLVELLVACTILGILLVALLSITNSTLSVTRLSQRRMDGGAALRNALDRMAADLNAVIVRDDLPPLFVVSSATNGSDEFYFAAQAEGYDGDRGVTIIGYRIREGKLERGAQGAGWTNNPMPFAQPVATNSITPTNFDVVGSKVFRLKVEFIGTNGMRITNSIPPTNWSQVSALVVSLAGVDSRALQSGSGTQEQLADLLPGIAILPAAGILIDWQQTLDSDGFYTGNDIFSAETRRGIKLRQRVLPILSR